MTEDSNVRKSRAGNSRKTSEKQRRNQHVLDVSVRSSLAGQQRKRRLVGMLSKTLLIAGLGTGLYFGVSRGVAHLILKNPDYNVSNLDVETDGMLDPAAVLAKADLHKGSNIFLVNLEQAKSRVEAIPQVEKVEVTRQLPNRICIQISERKPVAWIAPAHGAATRDEVVASKQSFLIDAAGTLLQPCKVSAQDRYLPIIRNYSGSPLTEGQPAEGEEIRAALELIHAQQESVLAARFQIQEIDLAKHFGLQVTDRNGMQVLFALDDMDRQLKRLDLYLQFADQRAEKPQTINLLAQRNVPVTFVIAEVSVDKPADSPVPAPATPAPGVAKAPVAGKEKPASEKQKKHDHAVSKPNAHFGFGAPTVRKALPVEPVQ